MSACMARTWHIWHANTAARDIYVSEDKHATWWYIIDYSTKPPSLLDASDGRHFFFLPSGPTLRVSTLRLSATCFLNSDFRILSTSPGACLNAKIELVCPLLLHHCISHTGAADASIVDWHQAGGNLVGHRGFTRELIAGQIAPRRNGLLKACSSITSTINSVVHL